MDRPLCKCHGEPMMRNGYQYNGRQKWGCRLNRRAHSNDTYWNKGQREKALAVYRQRKAEGVCTRCGAPRLSEALCWDCLSKLEDRYAIS